MSVRAEDYQRSSDTIHIPLKYRGLQVRNLCLTVRLEHVLQKMGCSYLGDLEGQTYSSVQEDERVAKSVAGNLHFHDGKTYRLDAYCIMSNHSHLVFAPLEILDPTTTQAGSMRYDEREPRYYSLAKIMHSFKSYTSNESNKILQRGGEFWQHESYDHVIRDEPEWERIIAYVIDNPVKAGFVAQWQDWPYTYLRPPT